ncbi:hypothetical protein SK128_003110, partial [Halocaridina rubra]
EEKAKQISCPEEAGYSPLNKQCNNGRYLILLGNGKAENLILTDITINVIIILAL